MRLAKFLSNPLQNYLFMLDQENFRLMLISTLE